MFKGLGKQMPLSQRDIKLELFNPIILATSFCLKPACFLYFLREFGILLPFISLSALPSLLQRVAFFLTFIFSR
jgi:hypothetical protein